MIGALPAGSDADGADFGGHFWIPEGIASNIEETEQLYPMLCLYRRALRCGADGAGAYRGGRSMTEAYVPWGVPGMAAALYIDDSFPKAVGPFGANPGSMGRVRVKHGVGLAEQFAAGVVPQELDALPGQEQPVDHKGPLLMLGADSVITWTGANSPGYGDPLARSAQAVAGDVGHGWLDQADATRVYAVAWNSEGDVDESATQRLREQRLAARLAAATPPATTPTRPGRGGRGPASGRRRPWRAPSRRPSRGVGVPDRPGLAGPGHRGLPGGLCGPPDPRQCAGTGIRHPARQARCGHAAA